MAEETKKKVERTKRKKLYVSDENFARLEELGKALGGKDRTKALAHLIEKFTDLAIELALEQSDIREVLKQRYTKVIQVQTEQAHIPVDSEPESEASEAFDCI